MVVDQGDIGDQVYSQQAVPVVRTRGVAPGLAGNRSRGAADRSHRTLRNRTTCLEVGLESYFKIFNQFMVNLLII